MSLDLLVVIAGSIALLVYFLLLGVSEKYKIQVVILGKSFLNIFLCLFFGLFLGYFLCVYHEIDLEHSFCMCILFLTVSILLYLFSLSPFNELVIILVKSFVFRISLVIFVLCLWAFLILFSVTEATIIQKITENMNEFWLVSDESVFLTDEFFFDKKLLSLFTAYLLYLFVYCAYLDFLELCVYALPFYFMLINFQKVFMLIEILDLDLQKSMLRLSKINQTIIETMHKDNANVRMRQYSQCSLSKMFSPELTQKVVWYVPKEDGINTLYKTNPDLKHPVFLTELQMRSMAEAVFFSPKYAGIHSWSLHKSLTVYLLAQDTDLGSNFIQKRFQAIEASGRMLRLLKQGGLQGNFWTSKASNFVTEEDVFLLKELLEDCQNLKKSLGFSHTLFLSKMLCYSGLVDNNSMITHLPGKHQPYLKYHPVAFGNMPLLPLVKSSTIGELNFRTFVLLVCTFEEYRRFAPFIEWGIASDPSINLSQQKLNQSKALIILLKQNSTIPSIINQLQWRGQEVTLIDVLEKKRGEFALQTANENFKFEIKTLDYIDIDFEEDRVFQNAEDLLGRLFRVTNNNLDVLEREDMKLVLDIPTCPLDSNLLKDEVLNRMSLWPKRDKILVLTAKDKVI